MNNWLNNNQTLNFSSFSHLIFKQNCVMCAASTKSELCLCKECIDSLPLAPNPSCPQCGLNTQGETCGNCLKHAPHYDATQALLSYGFPADAILQHYKYSNALYLSETFGYLLSDNILNANCDVIIPMPLHITRQQSRGFNQSLEVAKVVAQQLNIPLDSASCSRIKNTVPQASLPLKERLKNMHGAFQIKSDIASDTIKGKRIAIIDDVMTTGSSLNELAKTLKKAGAMHVECWVIARALTK